MRSGDLGLVLRATGPGRFELQAGEKTYQVVLRDDGDLGYAAVVPDLSHHRDPAAAAAWFERELGGYLAASGFAFRVLAPSEAGIA